MKPFDLEAALAGAPVVTRDGIPVTQLTQFDINDGEPLRGVRRGRVLSFQKDGRYTSSGDSNDDLFMAPVKRVVWVNLYEGAHAFHYATEKEADNKGSSERVGGKAHPLEIEE